MTTTPDDNLPLAAAQIATLLETFQNYAAGCTFKPGDLITPRAGFNLHGVGIPHVVLEAIPLADTRRNLSGDSDQASFGARIDLRYARLAASPYDGGTSVVAFWEESWKFERYVAAPE